MQTRVLKRHKLLQQQQDESIVLDDELVCILMEIERIYLHYPKHVQIRIERWVEKVTEPIVNVQWKRNANLYAMLLLEMTRTGNFRPPFDHNPPTGPLATLPRYLIHTLDSVTNKPLARDGKNRWSKAYERVVARTLPTSNGALQRKQDNKVKHEEQRELIRPASYVEMTNQTLDQLEIALENEKIQCASLTAQLQELKIVSTNQTEALAACKNELEQTKAMHKREIDRINQLHLAELEERKKQHQKQVLYLKNCHFSYQHREIQMRRSFLSLEEEEMMKKQRLLHEFFVKNDTPKDSLSKRLDILDETDSDIAVEEDVAERRTALETTLNFDDVDGDPDDDKPKYNEMTSERSEAGDNAEMDSSQYHPWSQDFGTVPCFSRMYSQDDFADFSTPQDQPVLQMSHPRSPSPVKKRQRTAPRLHILPFCNESPIPPNLMRTPSDLDGILHSEVF
ncbi:hypothetical protein THRCLA_07868, partial [Thraustotheca clavata]